MNRQFIRKPVSGLYKVILFSLPLLYSSKDQFAGLLRNHLEPYANDGYHKFKSLTHQFYNNVRDRISHEQDQTKIPPFITFWDIVFSILS